MLRTVSERVRAAWAATPGPGPAWLLAVTALGLPIAAMVALQGLLELDVPLLRSATWGALIIGLVAGSRSCSRSIADNSSGRTSSRPFPASCTRRSTCGNSPG